MKQFSSILNIVLLIAVAILYYLHFSKSDNKKDTIQKAESNKHVDSCLGGPVIAYVDLDSLNNNVDYIKQQKKQLEKEQSIIANEYENAYREMEAEKNNFLKKGEAITQKEAEEFQMRLQQRQQQVEANRQIKGQKLAENSAKTMEDVQSKLKSFLNEYNKDKRYTYILATGTGLDYLFYKDSARNITREVVAGLNQIMNKKGN